MTTTATCPEWCTSKGKMGDGENGHDGPGWPSLPIGGGTDVLEIYARSDQSRMFVNIDAHGVDLTPEQAMQAGRYLIEAGEWALAHQVA